MRRQTALLTLALATTLAAAACTSSDAHTGAPTTASAEPEQVTTSLEPTTTVRRTTTTAATTTTSTTTTSTTVAPTTTVIPTTLPEPTTVPVPVTPPPPPAPELLAPPAPLQPTRSGQGGAAVLALQQRLLQLGFWLDSADSRYGAVTAQAVMAFQKHHGLAADGIAGPNTTALLNQPLPRVQGKAAEGDLIEVDKAKQVLYIVRGGVTAWAINTSTGTGAEFTEFSEKEQREISGTSITPEGVFNVNRERPDGWWTGELGDLYRPKYFRGGVAVHGSNRIPNYPASHGCVRVSVAAMDYIWAENIMPMKSAVWVHAG